MICAGSGGVGKTTTAAALAMGAAAEGAKVAVVTIDPARRLANSLGLEELGNEPRLIDRARFAEYGVEMRGELWALMLDAKRTFDELIEHLAPDGYEKPAGARLTDREQQVLSLIAAGHPTREVAQQLCYSERTVKNVLHDVVTKLNARSRSQAVAFAVREGLI